MLIDRLDRLIKLRYRGRRIAEHGDRQVPDGLRDLLAKDGEGLLLLAGDQDPLAVADQMTDQVGDGMRLTGPRRPLNGNPGMLRQPPGDRLLLRVCRQRHQQAPGRLAPGTVLALTAFAIQPARLVGYDSSQRRGHLDLLRHQRVTQAREESPVKSAAPPDQQDPARRDSRSRRHRGWPTAVGDLAIEAERGQQLLVENAAPLVKGADRVSAELLTEVNQQVEPLKSRP